MFCIAVIKEIAPAVIGAIHTINLYDCIRMKSLLQINFYKTKRYALREGTIWLNAKRSNFTKHILTSERVFQEQKPTGN